MLIFGFRETPFLLPASTLNIWPGGPDPQLRGTVRIWDYKKRLITNTIPLISSDGPAAGTMDVKMVPNDPRGYGYVSGMFDGHIYLVDPVLGTATEAFDCSTVTPHVDTDVVGGMGQILAIPREGNRLIFALFQAGQVGMLDTTDRAHLNQLSVVSFGKNTGPTTSRSPTTTTG